MVWLHQNIIKNEVFCISFNCFDHIEVNIFSPHVGTQDIFMVLVHLKIDSRCLLSIWDHLGGMNDLIYTQHQAAKKILKLTLEKTVLAIFIGT